jgi:sulfate adenylyltransferase
MVDFKQMVYVQEKAQYYPVDEVPEGSTVLDISGTELRRRLREGLEIPDWFSFPRWCRTAPHLAPAVQAGLHRVLHRPLRLGKSTIANALMVKLMEMGGRPVTLLDGDVVRKHLSSELGFSKEHRDINIKRIGYVASEITKNGGIAICAPIAPYTATRRAVREMIEAFGAFIEVHVATSIEECERRDRKGLYKLAREGKIKEFTGISDPYEAPDQCRTGGGHRECRCRPLRPRCSEAGKHGPHHRGLIDVDLLHCAQQVILKLESMGLRSRRRRDQSSAAPSGLTHRLGQRGDRAGSAPDASAEGQGGLERSSAGPRPQRPDHPHSAPARAPITSAERSQAQKTIGPMTSQPRATPEA